MRSILLALLLLFGFTSAKASPQTPAVNPVYFCSINGENPVNRGTYDQTLFAGEVLKNSLTEVILIKPDLRVIRAVDFASLPLSTQEWLNLDRTIFVSLNLTEPTVADEKRTLMISLGRVVGTAGQPGNWNITSVAFGYYKGPLILIDRALNIAVHCQL